MDRSFRRRTYRFLVGIRSPDNTVRARVLLNLAEILLPTPQIISAWVRVKSRHLASAEPCAGISASRAYSASPLPELAHT